MLKKISVLEQLLLLNMIVLIIVSIIINPVVNGKETLWVVKESFGFFNFIFKGQIFKTVAMISVILSLLAFIVYWITNIFIYKVYSLGPIYLLIFMVVYVYANGYYNISLKADAYFISLIFILVWSFGSSIIGYIKYYRTINDMKEE